MKHFKPATYMCARCRIECNGDANRLPIGWAIMRTQHGNRDGKPICDDCLRGIGHRAPESRRQRFRRLTSRPTPAMLLGILAARFSGALMLASEMPRPEARQ